MLVYPHIYNSNIGLWWVDIWLNIIATIKQTNNKSEIDKNLSVIKKGNWISEIKRWSNPTVLDQPLIVGLYFVIYCL